MKETTKATAWVRLWGLRNVFLLWFVRPRILELSGERCVVKIPLTWRTKNHLKSMYFGALCIGADIAGGLMAFDMATKSRVRISFVFKDVTGRFLKRAEGDVHFTNEDGRVIRALLDRAIATGERQEAVVNVVATVPSKMGTEPVATFEMTLSLKKAGASA